MTLIPPLSPQALSRVAALVAALCLASCGDTPASDATDLVGAADTEPSADGTPHSDTGPLPDTAPVEDIVAPPDVLADAQESDVEPPDVSGDDTPAPPEDSGPPTDVDPLDDTGAPDLPSDDDAVDSSDVPDVPDEPDAAPCTDCPDNSPCEASSGPGSSDPTVTACVCATDAYCCDVVWDSTCVDNAAVNCGVVCGCDGGTTACDDDADCGPCGGDACSGAFSCVEGLCARGAPLACQDSDPNDCLAVSCDAAAGACVTAPDDGACDDGDPCTAESCDASGQCVATPLPECVAGDPCVVHAGGSSDPEVTLCVCALDDYCCGVAWDATCVALATSSCGHTCDCPLASDAALTCLDDTDCVACSANLCATPWRCVSGVCAASAPVECDTSADGECVVTHCDPASGECAIEAGPDLCDDDDPCTTEVCELSTGACLHEDAGPLCGKVCGVDPVACSGDADCKPCQTDPCTTHWGCVNAVCAPKPAPTCTATGCDVATCHPTTGVCAITPVTCGAGHPCVASGEGGSGDPVVSACVCAADPYCCAGSWDEACVSLAVLSCGLACDCREVPSKHPCEQDTDCAYCGATPCGAVFSCANGQCAAPADTCGSAPAFVCHGAGVPAADGCATTATAEGCCDALGRVVWCEGGKTFCIDCPAAKVPSCGFSDAGFYDCATSGAADPTGSFPLECAQ